MGIAALFIIICHAPANGVKLPPVLNTIFIHCDVGVDIFLLLSGFGLYYSLQKWKKHFLERGHILMWYKVRLMRLFVPYLIFIVPLISWKSINNGFLWGEILLDLTTFSFWFNGRGLWFISMLVPVYFISPFVYELVKKGRGDILLILCIFVSFSAGCIIDMFVAECFYKQLLFCLMRYPSFVLGMCCANGVLNDNSFAKKYLLIIVLSILVFLCIKVILNVDISLLAVYWAISGGIVVLLTFLLEYTSPLLKRFFRFMGKISLESYCTNVYIAGSVMILFSSFSESVSYLISVIFCILMSCIIHILSEFVYVKYYNYRR